MAHKRTSRSSAPRAFSLVELLVVLGLVSLLAGLTVRVMQSVAAAAERRETVNTLEMLRTATVAWESDAARKLTWWHPGDSEEMYRNADVHADTVEVFVISEILDALTRVPTSRDVIAKIDTDLVHQYQKDQYPAWIVSDVAKNALNESFSGTMTVVDAWGTPIYATHPGRAWRESDGLYPPHDVDGTVLTYNEWKYGIASNRQIVYVSAGPDRRFGLPEEFSDLTGPELNAAVNAAREDNLYSSSVEFFN